MGHRALIQIPRNRRIGSRTIIKAGVRQGNSYWLMRCSCGNKNWVRATRAENTTVCKPCSNRARSVAALGERFGTRTVVEIATVGGYRRCLMLCKCGEKTWVFPSAARRGRVNSCPSCSYRQRRVDVPLGEQNGRRVVLGVGVRAGNTHCLVQCACGDKRWVNASHRTRTQTCFRCGCERGGLTRVVVLNKLYHPNLKEKELRQLLALHVYKKQSIKELQEAL